MRNEKGYTLVELLVIVVILNILSAIAVVGIGQLIEHTKKEAFVANAIMVKEAAALYVTSEIERSSVTSQVTYQFLYDHGFIDTIKDPFTNNDLSPEKNETTATVSGGTVVSVCLKGETKKLCPETLEELTTENIE